MKVFKILLSVFFLIFMIGCLLYKNLLAPDDKNSIFFRLGEMFIPLFMMFSLFLMALKKREENGKKEKTSSEDRKKFSSLEN